MPVAIKTSIVRYYLFSIEDKIKKEVYLTIAHPLEPKNVLQFIYYVYFASKYNILLYIVFVIIIITLFI